jgi:DNA-binding transcriptional regulator YhcF (GntR family)
MSEKPKAGRSKQIELRRNERKWTRPLMEAGWTAWPSILLERQRELGLDALDVNILLQLAKHWWEADNPPYPSKRSIAAAIGVDPRTVQRRIERMEKVGLVRRRERRDPHGGTKTNAYLFDGLIQRATPYAREKLREIEDRRRAKRMPRRRGLRLVDGGKP